MVFSKKKVREALDKEVHRKHTILIVDDEESNLRALSALLAGRYNVLEASSGNKALEMIEAMDDPTKINLIISDQRMPGLTGVSLFTQLLDLLPRTKRILLTAFKDVSVIMDSINRAQIYKYMLKPYDRDDLLLTVQRALELFDAQQELDAYRLDLEKKVERRSRALLDQAHYSALGTMILGMADRLKNPLNFVNGLSQISVELLTELEDKLQDNAPVEETTGLFEDLKENMALVYKNGNRLNTLVEGMMMLDREEGMSRQSLDVTELLNENADLAGHRMHALHPKFKMQIETHYDAHTTLEVEPIPFSRVLNAIFNNAVEALFERLGRERFEPRLIVETEVKDNKMKLSIKDNGIGISEEDLPRVFDHFFTTKSGEHGHVGLGLTLVSDFVRNHRGDIRIDAKPGNGARVTLSLPLNVV